jgi:hypothetical protein
MQSTQLLLKSDDGGQTWSEMLVRTQSAFRNVLVGPWGTGSDVVLCGRKLSGGPLLWLSRDAGSTWTEMVDGLPPDAQHLGPLCADSLHPGIIYTSEYVSATKVYGVWRLDLGGVIDVRNTGALHRDPTLRIVSNPARGVARFEGFHLAGTEPASVLDVTGRVVRVLGPGRDHFVWTGRDERGALLPAGTYFVQPFASPSPPVKFVWLPD